MLEDSKIKLPNLILSDEQYLHYFPFCNVISWYIDWVTHVVSMYFTFFAFFSKHFSLRFFEIYSLICINQIFQNLLLSLLFFLYSFYFNTYLLFFLLICFFLPFFFFHLIFHFFFHLVVDVSPDTSSSKTYVHQRSEPNSYLGFIGFIALILIPVGISVGIYRRYKDRTATRVYVHPGKKLNLLSVTTTSVKMR